MCPQRALGTIELFAKGTDMAARPTWTGTVSFALLSVPVKLYTAVRSKDISFNQLEKSTGQRIKQKRVSSVSGDEVTSENIVKGYDLGGDRYVVIDPEELEQLSPRDATNEKTIQILEFVDQDEIDPIYFEKPYYLAPDKGGARPYGLLVAAMKSTNKVAVAKIVMRTKEYVAIIRPMGHFLCMETMVFADEVVSPAEVDGLPDSAMDIAEKELDMAKMLIETTAGTFDPTRYRDEYREKVLALIEAKASGEVYEMPKLEEAPKVIDLMAALEASLAAAKARKLEAA
jgi:DNA end-binding protein Ku